MTNEERIEELEIALERLLECFDTSVAGQRPWIEVEVENDSGVPNGTGMVFIEAQVTEPTAEAIELAELTLYQDDVEIGELADDES